jgi:hypothetical protein
MPNADRVLSFVALRVFPMHDFPPGCRTNLSYRKSCPYLIISNFAVDVFFVIIENFVHMLIFLSTSKSTVYA